MSDTLMVGIVVGSKSDLDVMKQMQQGARRVRHRLGDRRDVGAPRRRRGAQLRAAGRQRGLRVLVAGAGAAAHLPGVLASLTTLPVIGVPLAATPLSGFNSLLSIVQMPPGIPVATVAVGDMGARNAGHLAAEIIGLFDDDVAASLADHRAKMRENRQATGGVRPLDRGRSAELNRRDQPREGWRERYTATAAAITPITTAAPTVRSSASAGTQPPRSRRPHRRRPPPRLRSQAAHGRRVLEATSTTTSSAAVSVASSMTNGGSRRMTVRPAGSTRMPRS